MVSDVVFDSLLSVLQAPQGIKPPLLRSLYSLLVRLANPQWSARCGLDSDQLEIEIDSGGMVVKFAVIDKLSNILFKELSERFEWFFSALHDVSISKDVDHSSILLDKGVDAEILLLLLRCCLVILIQLAEQQNLLLEKGQVLLVILQKLSSFHLAGRKKTQNWILEKSVCQAHTNANNGCTTSSLEDIVASLQFLDQSDSLLSSVSAILEAFVDELTVHRHLREYFRLIDSVLPLGENLFVHSGQGAIGVLVEMVSCHFTLSFSDEKAVEDSVNKLFLVQEEEFKHSLRAPAVSLTAATSLLFNPVMLSAPKIMLAHVISLVSEACSNTLDLESFKLNDRPMDCLVPIFEKSVNLYHECMCTLQVEGLSRSARASSVKANMKGRSSQPSFESYMSPGRRRKIDDILRMLDDYSNSRLQNIVVGMKSEMVNSTIKHVKKSQNFLDIPCEDEVLPILSNLILRASDGFNDTVAHAFKDDSLQDIYLLSSVLKLMGTSLLSAVFCLKHSNNLGSTRTPKEFLSCKEYGFILNIISCLKEFSILVPIEQQLYDMMEASSPRHKDSKMIFIHFSGLLSLAFVSGLDCLAKGCLLIIKAVMYMFIFEEGNLDALQLLVDCATKSSSSGLPLVKVHESEVDKRSSLVIASKFQKIRTLFSRTTTSRAIRCIRMEVGDFSQASTSASTLCNTEDIVDMEEETEEATNGEIYLNCLVQKKTVSDFDDLADFIECKPGKDYAAWLKERQKYRNWKCEKMAVLRWKRKKKTWKLIKGKKT